MVYGIVLPCFTHINNNKPTMTGDVFASYQDCDFIGSMEIRWDTGSTSNIKVRIYWDAGEQIIG